jgi:hypothetical protein
MEVDLVHRKIYGLSNAKFSPGDDVESQALFLKYESQSPVQEGFGGINDQGIRMIFTELVLKFTALMADGEFIEKIERRAEFVSQVNNIAAADKEVTLLIYLSSEGKKS